MCLKLLFLFVSSFYLIQHSIRQDEILNFDKTIQLCTYLLIPPAWQVDFAM